MGEFCNYYQLFLGAIEASDDFYVHRFKLFSYFFDQTATCSIIWYRSKGVMTRFSEWNVFSF